ncbi:MAG TPA: DNA-protecting protein DprA [Actinobacteria bacterium]|nr:DNA-protecting protein DprA [Actinomycetota bacterium]
MDKNTLKILNLIINENIKPADISKFYKDSGSFDIKMKNKNGQKASEKDSVGEGGYLKRNMINHLIESFHRKEFQIINIAQEIYPYLLKEIFFSPPLLFCKGKAEILKSKLCIAVVGTRKCSRYGMDAAGFLSRELSKLGFTIVSGMAMGIDRIAHGAVLNENGKSIGVLGTGIDVTYPPENRDLFRNMIKNGCLITEFFPSVKPLKQNFPARNRIISGISIGVIIIEAGEKSGAVITAKAAVRENREVFAVPGSIFSDNSLGCHKLIQNGAKLIHGIDDILVELENYIKDYGIKTTKSETKKEEYVNRNKKTEIFGLSISADQKKIIAEVLNCIDYNEKSFEEIQKITNMDKNKLLQIISFLQLNDYIIEKSFNNYVLNK